MPALTPIQTPPTLHGAARTKRGERIGWYSVVEAVPEAGGRFAEEGSPVGVFAREVQQVDATEDDEEAAEEGYGVYRVGGVEASKEDEGGDEGEGREGYVVEWVDPGVVSH